MNSYDGIKEIDAAQWIKSVAAFDCLDLIVHDEADRKIYVWMQLRPPYCDRGHVQVNIEGVRDLDDADMFPRYFFSFEEADKHMRAFLKWRLWKYRTHPHTLDGAR